MKGPETSDMTFLGLGEMFEGYSAETYVEKFPLMLIGGRAGVSCVCRHGIEDPHRRERKLFIDSLRPKKSIYFEQFWMLVNKLW